jgi:hypothetical protein
MEKKPYYEMFSPAGERACQALVDKITKKILSPRRVTAADVLDLIEQGMKKISVQHGEVFDTEPRVQIAHQISKALRAAGYGFYFNYFMTPTEGLPA